MSTRRDGLPYTSAGAKAGNGEDGDEYEKQTESQEPIDEGATMADEGEDFGDDEEPAPLDGPGTHGAVTPYGMHARGAEGADEDETLLDDSEHDPIAETPVSDPGVKTSEMGMHGSAIGDPEPDTEGLEGHETHDEGDDDEDEDD